MIQLDEPALTAAALLVESAAPEADQPELNLKNRATAARIIEAYLSALGSQEYLEALEFAAEIADEHSSILLSDAKSWVAASVELADRYTEAAQACAEVAIKIRDEAQRHMSRLPDAH